MSLFTKKPVVRAHNLSIGGKVVTFNPHLRAYGFVKRIDESRDLYVLKPFHLIAKLFVRRSYAQK